MMAVNTSAPVPYLVALQPLVSPEEIGLEDGGCTLGRGAACHVVVPRPVVSRLHAQIERNGARFQLRDLGSINGTYVNGQRLYEPHLLAQHDLIGLGEAAPLLSFVDPDSTHTAAATLRYDERSMRFSIGQDVLELTPNQFRLLLHLHRHRGEVCPREECAVAVWGPNFAPGMDATTLDRLLSTLRGALRKVDPDAQLIETRAGLGYRLTDAA
jgi:DNA-binding response OmpR family regulator